MKRSVAVLKLNKNYWCILSLCIIVCTLFWGLQFSRTEGMENEITIRYNFLINPLGALQGLVIGFLSANILYRLASMVKGGGRKDERWTAKKEILKIILFLIFAFTIFYFLIIIQFEQKEPLNRLIIKNGYKYSFLFAILSSWALIGKIKLFSGLGVLFDKLFIMLTKLFRLEGKDEMQYKLIISVLFFVVFFVVFPPWKAYWSSSGGEGLGQTEFADFHYIFANQYTVFGEAPYSMAEIYRQFQIILISLTFIVGLYLLFVHKKSIRGQCDMDSAHLLE